LLSRHLVEQEVDTWHKSTTMWKATWGLSHWKTHDNPMISKITLEGGYSCIRVELFPSLGEETRLPPPQELSQIRMWIVLEATI
jgi:hypothetical protein